MKEKIEMLKRQLETAERKKKVNGTESLVSANLSSLQFGTESRACAENNDTCYFHTKSAQQLREGITRMKNAATDFPPISPLTGGMSSLWRSTL